MTHDTIGSGSLSCGIVYPRDDERLLASARKPSRSLRRSSISIVTSLVPKEIHRWE